MLRTPGVDVDQQGCHEQGTYVADNQAPLELSSLRDDSGNSSSNSSVMSSLEQLQPTSPTADGDVDRRLTTDGTTDDPARVTSSAVSGYSDRLWQSVDLHQSDDLYSSGYELLDVVDGQGVHVPLHKTVCCALCRKKQERKLQLLQQQAASWPPTDTDSCQGHDELANNSRQMTMESGANNNSLADDYHCNASNSIDETTSEQHDSDHSTSNSLIDTPGKSSSRTKVRRKNSADSATSDGPTSSNQRRRTKVGQKGDDASKMCNGNVSKTADNCQQRSSVFHRNSSSPSLRPISDPLVLQALQSSGNTHLQISPKDEKLMALLAAKREQERQQKAQRDMYRQQWEKEGASRASTDRRRSLIGSRRQDQNQSDVRGSPNNDVSDSTARQQQQRSDCGDESHVPGGGRALHRSISEPVCRKHHVSGCGCGRDHSRAVAVVKSPKSATGQCSCSRKNPDDEQPACCERCAALAQEQLERKDQQKSNKQLQQSIERKAQVEKRLEEQRNEMEKYMSELKQKQEQEVDRVNSAKQEKQILLAEKAKAKSMQLRSTLEQAREQQRQTQEELSLLQETLEANLTAAEIKAKRLREEELKKIRADLQRKIDRAREKQQEMDEELRKWQESIKQYMEWQEKNAQANVEAQRTKKREAVARWREDKQRLQRENLEKMQEREREWKAGVEAAIQYKAARSRMFQEEKEAAKKQAREMAQVSRQMREELRLGSSSDFTTP